MGENWNLTDRGRVGGKVYFKTEKINTILTCCLRRFLRTAKGGTCTGASSAESELDLRRFLRTAKGGNCTGASSAESELDRSTGSCYIYK